ncbi:hypothetical protein FACS1894113_2820 [Alphaproteobacteria bacterium]|nr:hypothetical protein FACS1894113_2820 [Alphaproteobacteria bacterium]
MLKQEKKKLKNVEILEMNELYTYVQKRIVFRIWTAGGRNLRCFSAFDNSSRRWKFIEKTAEQEVSYEYKNHMY